MADGLELASPRCAGLRSAPLRAAGRTFWVGCPRCSRETKATFRRITATSASSTTPSSPQDPKSSPPIASPVSNSPATPSRWRNLRGGPRPHWIGPAARVLFYVKTNSISLRLQQSIQGPIRGDGGQSESVLPMMERFGSD
jgi:hypothetical protein